MRTTHEEMSFIRGLGTHSLPGRTIPRATLLRHDLAACAQRAVWEGMEPPRVQRCAAVSLLRMEKAD